MPRNNAAATDEFDSFDTYDVSGGTSAGVIDLSAVPEEVEYPVLPNGVYPATIDGAEFGNSQRSGNPMITWTLRVPLQDGGTRLFFYHTVLTEQALPRLKKMLVRLAPNANREFDMAKFNPNEAAEIFTGVPCQIRLKSNVYEGKRRNQVTDVLPSSGSSDEFE